MFEQGIQSKSVNMTSNGPSGRATMLMVIIAFDGGSSVGVWKAWCSDGHYNLTQLCSKARFFLFMKLQDMTVYQWNNWTFHYEKHRTDNKNYYIIILSKKNLKPLSENSDSIKINTRLIHIDLECFIYLIIETRSAFIGM